MPGPQAVKVVVPEKLRADLLRASMMERGSHRDVVRARIVLLAERGLTNSEIAAKAGCTAFRELTRHERVEAGRLSPCASESTCELPGGPGGAGPPGRTFCRTPPTPS
jgi:hypothetical protein